MRRLCPPGLAACLLGAALLAVGAAPAEVSSGRAPGRPAPPDAVGRVSYLYPAVVDDDFGLDPRAFPEEWKLRGTWDWRLNDRLKGRLAASPFKRNLGCWLSDLFAEGRVSARLMLVDTPDENPPRAGVIFGRQPDTRAYRYVLLEAGRPGEVILGQRGTVGDLEPGILARAPARISRRTWLRLDVEVLEEGGANIYLDGSPVLSVDASVLPPAGPGRVGLRSVRSRAVFDRFSFALVDKPPPEACFTAAPDSPLRGESVRFDASCSVAGENRAIVSWEWDFDYDGTFAADALGPVADLAFLTAGTHTVALRVTDDDLWPLTGLATLPVTVAPDPPPTACFEVLTDPVLCGREALLDASCSTHDSPLRTIVSWEWDFDYDGSFAADATGETVLKAYGASGSHTTVLRVTDDASPPRSATLMRQLDVEILNTAPTADPGGPYQVSWGADLELDGSGSADPDEACNDSVTAWEWDLDYDGLFDDASGETVTLAWEEVQSFVYRGICLPGIPCPVSLRVTDSLGAVTVGGTLITLVVDNDSACPLCHGGSPPAGYESAPNVMTYWQDSGHGDPTGKPALACSDCHDIGLPAGPATHLDGVLNSAEAGLNTNTNTAHLMAAFINDIPVNPWDVQVTFDGACWACHAANGIIDMRHSLDADPVANAVQFGQKMTVSDGESIGWPVDSDISTYADTAEPDFAPCVSCHNPHGTGVDEPSKPTGNRMVRMRWVKPPYLCGQCHE